MALLLGSATAAHNALDEFAWLAGHWEGTGIDGAPASEIYSPAAGGQIVGHFRQLNSEGRVSFYELITLDAPNGQPRLRLKHFNTDLTGWEERDVVREFPLRSRSRNRWDFSGLIIERTSQDRMQVQVEVDEDGRRSTLEFRYRRKRN